VGPNNDRDGRVKVRVAQNLRADTLAYHVASTTDQNANLHSDEAMAYKGNGEQFASHERLCHNAGQYVHYTLDGTQVRPNSMRASGRA
jgi:hypothetical protein